MIEHHAYLRLRDPWDAGEGLHVMIADLRRVAGELPGSPALSVGIPADAHARAAWDLAVTLTFGSAELHTHAQACSAWQELDALVTERSVVAKGWSFVQA